MDNNFIPVSKPSITQVEMDYIMDAVQSTWISSLGPYIDRLEKEFAAFCDCEYAVSLCNGTVAIHLALLANNIGPGDEVIVPDLSFIATANAVLHAGATPVFIDIDGESLCMDPELIEAAITTRTKAIMPVHLYGHPADMVRINAIAAKHNLAVIEDAAEAHGSTVQNKKVGSWGQSATFSFYGNKNMTTGEGGMITTNDKSFYEHCRYLRDHAMSREKRYWHTEVGFNYRMTNVQAALGCAQLSRVDYFLQRRQEIYNAYQEELGGINGVKLNRCLPGYHNTFWLICAEFDHFTYDSRDAFILQLKTKGIDSRPYFYPMSHMPYFQKANTPLSVRKSEIGVSLPTYSDLTTDDIRRICNAVKELI